MIDQFLLVGVGGAIGSLFRYEISKIQPYHDIPVGTLLVNVTGTFLLSLLTFSAASGDIVYLVSIGGLGGYTTFSTFMFETFRMVEEHTDRRAGTYLLLSLVSSLLAIGIGYLVCGGVSC